jgi:hypothetical protein
LCGQFSAESGRIDEVDEGSLAVDLNHRQPLAVLGLELVVAADVDFLELERHLGTCFVEDGAGALAEVTALCVIEPDLRDRSRG